MFEIRHSGLSIPEKNAIRKSVEKGPLLTWKEREHHTSQLKGMGGD